MNRRYLIAVALLAVLAVVFGLVGTVAPPLSGEAEPSESSSSSSSSVAHFQNPPTYDSGWVDITDKQGQYLSLNHGLDTSEVAVDITGKQIFDYTDGPVAFVRTYGGTGSDNGWCVVETGDGGYAIAGYSRSFSGGNYFDFWLIRTDSFGNTLWDRTYGGSGHEYATSLLQTSDGGYIIAGFTNSFGDGTPSYYNFWVVKTDINGNKQWDQWYGGARDDEAYSVVETIGGGYALAGYTDSFGDGTPSYSNFWVVKIDPSGNTQWDQWYGGTSDDHCMTVVQTSGEEFALAGYTNSYGASGYDFWLVKIDKDGNEKWAQPYGGTGTDYGLDAVYTGDGGYAMTGWTSSYGAGGYDFWLVKIDSSGNMQWNRTYGGAKSDNAYSVIQTGDGGYAIAGYTNSYGAGLTDFWLVKADSAGGVLWNETYGGAKNDQAYCVVRTYEGGYAIVGYTQSYGAGLYDFMLVKKDSVIVEGEINEQHQRHLGGTGVIPGWSMTYGPSKEERTHSVVQTSDGGYALAGFTGSIGPGSASFWLVKTDSFGNTLWKKTYGWVYGDVAYSVVLTADGGYAMAGYTYSFGVGTPSYSNFWLVKTDIDGNKQWDQWYGGTSHDIAYSLVQINDGGYAIAGYTESYGAGGGDFWLVKTDSLGNMLWNQPYGGTGEEYARSLIKTGDGGYALAGYTDSYGIGGDFWLVKTDSAGNMLWNRTYGGTGIEVAYSVVQTRDGGYALVGYTNSFGAGSNDFWLVKTDWAGNMLWNRTYGGTDDDIAYSLVQTCDEGYALAGSTSSYGEGIINLWFVKTNSTGGTLWSRTCGGAGPEGYTGYNEAYSMVQTNDGGYALAGYTTSYSYVGSENFWLVKTETESGLACTALTSSSITLYRGKTDPYWNYVRVRIWTIKEPTWIYGDINMDGVVDVKDLYILSRNYGKTFSLLSLSGIIAVAGIQTIKKRKQNK